MANLAAPLIDFSGASGEPTSQGALVSEIAPPEVIVYTGGILVAPSAVQLTPQQAQGFPTS